MSTRGQDAPWTDKHTGEADAHCQGTPTSPMMGLYGYGWYENKPSAYTHPKALCKYKLIIFPGVYKRDHEQPGMD